MQLTYRNGRSADDRFFDLPLEEQRFHVARCLDLNPSTPSDWPVSVIDHILDIRKHEGLDAFYREVSALLTRS